MSKYQDLAVVSAIANAAIKAKEQLVDEIKAEVVEEYETSGTWRRGGQVTIAGLPVGQVVVTTTSPDWAIKDKRAFDEWAYDNGLATVRSTLSVEFDDYSKAKALKEALAALGKTCRLDTVTDYAEWKPFFVNTADGPVSSLTGEVVDFIEYVPKFVKSVYARDVDLTAIQQAERLLGEQISMKALAEGASNAE